LRRTDREHRILAADTMAVSVRCFNDDIKMYGLYSACAELSAVAATHNLQPFVGRKHDERVLADLYDVELDGDIGVDSDDACVDCSVVTVVGSERREKHRSDPLALTNLRPSVRLSHDGIGGKRCRVRRRS